MIATLKYNFFSIYHATIQWFTGLNNSLGCAFIIAGLGVLALVGAASLWFSRYQELLNLYKKEQDAQFEYGKRVYTFESTCARVDPFYFACWSDFYASKARLFGLRLQLKKLNPFLSDDCLVKYGQISSEKATPRAIEIYSDEAERHSEVSYYLSEIGFAGESSNAAFVVPGLLERLVDFLVPEGGAKAKWFDEQKKYNDMLKELYKGDSDRYWGEQKDACLQQQYIELKKKLLESYVTLPEVIQQSAVLVDQSSIPLRNLNTAGRLRRELLELEQTFRDYEHYVRNLPQIISKYPGASEPLLYEKIRVPPPGPLEPRTLTPRLPFLNSSKSLNRQFMLQLAIEVSERRSHLRTVKEQLRGQWTRESFSDPNTAGEAIKRLISYNEGQVSMNRLELRRLLYKERFDPSELDKALRQEILDNVVHSEFVLDYNKRTAEVITDSVGLSSFRVGQLQELPETFLDEDGIRGIRLNSCLEPAEQLSNGFLDSISDTGSPKEFFLGFLVALKKILLFIKDLF